jgi:hypothetical protein
MSGPPRTDRSRPGAAAVESTAFTSEYKFVGVWNGYGRGAVRFVVSDDRRVRTVARGLGATVTGTVGVLVRGVRERELSAEDGKELVRRVDSRGLHMTGELREKAYELVEDAAE